MHRTALVLGIIISVALGSAACSRADDDRNNEPDAALAGGDVASGAEITVTGCLTAAPDRDAFVVTADRNPLTSGALHAGSGETPTYTYELMGNAGDLAGHVGRQVEVTGRLDEDRKDEAEVDEEEKTELPAVQSGDRTVEPVIESETEMSINVRRLAVANVVATGQPCGTDGR